MPLVDLATAVRELRITLATGEDADLTRKLVAAEDQAALFLGRNVYVNQAALDLAKAAAPATITAATTAYNAAWDAAELMEAQAEREASERLAKDAYNDAFDAWNRTMRGIVLNDSIRTAILLITASLWEHRGDEDAIVGVPPAAERFLWPYRTGIGV